MYVALLGLDKRGEPQVACDVCAPAIEIEVVADQERFAVGTVEAHDMVIPIFDPDPSDEASFVLVVEGSDIEDQAADFAKNSRRRNSNL